MASLGVKLLWGMGVIYAHKGFAFISYFHNIVFQKPIIFETNQSSRKIDRLKVVNINEINE